MLLYRNRGRSSAGRALPSQGRSREFKSPRLHQRLQALMAYFCKCFFGGIQPWHTEIFLEAEPDNYLKFYCFPSSCHSARKSQNPVLMSSLLLFLLFLPVFSLTALSPHSLGSFPVCRLASPSVILRVSRRIQFLIFFSSFFFFFLLSAPKELDFIAQSLNSL